MKFRGFKLNFENRAVTESMIRQIDDFPSFFTPAGELPLIVDCGANIGISVLEWKTRWPQCRVLCFEPDPFAFRILQKNIDDNDIPSVRCVNAAVSDSTDPILLYGDIARGGDARGNSIDPAWGQRSDSGQITVRSVRLSRYLADQDVAFLKLDIEGAEQRVLEEIAGHLDRVSAIYVEVHETDHSASYNSSAGVERILRDAGFQLDTQSRYEPHALPAHLTAWQQQVGARQNHWMGWRDVA